MRGRRKTPAERARAVYDEPAREELFEQAYDLFPGYNGEQADEAADWIFGRLVGGRSLPQTVLDLLYEEIYEGLT